MHGMDEEVEEEEAEEEEERRGEEKRREEKADLLDLLAQYYTIDRPTDRPTRAEDRERRASERPCLLTSSARGLCHGS